MFQNILTELNYANLWPLQRYRDSYFNEVNRLPVQIQIPESMLRDSFCKARERDSEAVVWAERDLICVIRLVTREILDGRFEGFFLLVAWRTYDGIDIGFYKMIRFRY